MGHAHSTQSSRPRHPGPSHNHYSFYYPRLKYNKSLDPMSQHQKEISDSETTDSETDSDTSDLKAPPKHPPPLVNQYSLYYPRVKYDPTIDPLDAHQEDEQAHKKPNAHMSRIPEEDEAHEAQKDRPKGSNQPKDHQALTAMVAGYTGGVAKSDHHHDANHQHPGSARHQEHHHEQHGEQHHGQLVPGHETHAHNESHMNIAPDERGGEDCTGGEGGLADAGGDDGGDGDGF